MGKTADRYFRTAPWSVIENGFCPEYSQTSESVFSLGNEYMGTRGFFEEGYSGKSLIGNYFNGIYERKTFDKSYKGVVNVQEFMVNAVNWLYTRIEMDGETLDLNVSGYRDFRRELNMKTGVLTREFVWELKNGREMKVRFERFLSMRNPRLGGQKITLQPFGFRGSCTLTAGLDNSQIHYSVKKNLWICREKKADAATLELHAVTKNTGQSVCSVSRIGTDGQYIETQEKEKLIVNVYRLQLEPEKETVFWRVTENCVSRENDVDEQKKKRVACSIRNEDAAKLYEKEKKESASWWREIWKKADIEIRGDEVNQQGIRFCIFQMFQTYHGAQKGDNIGAKGLTGEAYNGNAFWDTEAYCLPFFLFNHIEAAKNLIDFRYLTLDGAKSRAAELDCEGAFYPIATISGRECCNLWQHASLQLQASTAVAYGIWLYARMADDKEYLYTRGIEMLIEISRMLATRGSWSPKDGSYGYYCVMGPDEFQMMVNHNFYTNAMAKFTFRYTCELLYDMRKEAGSYYKTVCSKTGVTEAEMEKWRQMEKRMYIPYDPDTKLFQQHEGYFSLPHIDVDKIPVEEFPLYDHWSYDRIYRNDMIKQPDVLMMMLLFNSYFDEEQLRRNYEYYEPRCIHESSLSPSVHSILASQLGKEEEAYEFFKFATRMDLDNYNRNTQEGLHTTSIAAAWMNIVYGFGGMRPDGEILSFTPTLPKQWEGYCFCVTYRGAVLHLEIKRGSVRIWTEDGNKVRIKIYGKEHWIGAEPLILSFEDKDSAEPENIC